MQNQTKPIPKQQKPQPTNKKQNFFLSSNSNKSIHDTQATTIAVIHSLQNNQMKHNPLSFFLLLFSDEKRTMPRCCTVSDLSGS